MEDQAFSWTPASDGEEYRRREQAHKLYNMHEIFSLRLSIKHLDAILTNLRSGGHGCACDMTGCCAAHADAYNAIVDAVQSLDRAVREFQSASDEYGHAIDRGAL